MKFKHHALALGCFAALGISSSAHALQIAGEALEVYGLLYPEYNITNFGDGSATGTASNTLVKGLATPGNLTASATPVTKTQLNWSQSYVGFKGSKAFGDVRVGYDLQGVVGKNVDTTASGTAAVASSVFQDTRDAFVSVSHAKVGTFQFGQMDTIYKEFGDRVRMLGVSSSNFVSTSGVLSGVGWKGNSTGTGTTAAAGTSSFNTRVGGQVRWLSPNWSGIEAGISYRPDPNKSATQNASLTALGLRWSDGPYYVAVEQETHNDYRAFSGTGYTASATTVYNTSPSSKDTANRVSFGYVRGAIKVGADVASLKYTEGATSTGKISNYSTTSWQVSGEYTLSPEWTLAANYASQAAGSCGLLGGAACSTNGLGGSLLSLGARYDFDKNMGIFMLYANNKVNSGATYASSAVGGSVTNLAVGLKVNF